MKNWIVKYKTPLVHLLFWVVFFLFPYIFSSSYSHEKDGHLHNKDDFFVLNMINKFFWVIIFYLNTQILIPRILYKKLYLQFIIIQLVTFSFMLLFDSILFKFLNINADFHFFKATLHNITPFIFTSLASVVFKLIWDKSKTDEKQKENLKTELAFLRSQISPHFLFNVLNNIVAMVRLKNDNLEGTVLKLSSLLQYMLYETDEEKVGIQTETEYLKSYIELQSQRFGNKIRIIKNIAINDSELLIEPMLLIPFVENAFKHGYGLIEDPIIQINLNIESNTLLFEVKNKYSSEKQPQDKVSGIGLANVKRRLELLYSNEHELKINEYDGWFIVSLKLRLKL